MKSLQRIIHLYKPGTGHLSVVVRQSVNQEKSDTFVVKRLNESVAVMVWAPQGNEKQIRTRARGPAVNCNTVNFQRIITGQQSGRNACKLTGPEHHLLTDFL